MTHPHLTQRDQLLEDKARAVQNANRYKELWQKREPGFWNYYALWKMSEQHGTIITELLKEMENDSTGNNTGGK